MCWVNATHHCIAHAPFHLKRELLSPNLHLKRDRAWWSRVGLRFHRQWILPSKINTSTPPKVLPETALCPEWLISRSLRERLKWDCLWIISLHDSALYGRHGSLDIFTHQVGKKRRSVIGRSWCECGKFTSPRLDVVRGVGVLTQVLSLDRRNRRRYILARFQKVTERGGTQVKVIFFN